MTPRDRTANGRFRILVIANETADGEALHRLILRHARNGSADVLVVAPAPAHAERLKALVGRLGAEGIAAHGWAGDSDPLEAIADALAIFPADQLIISTHPVWRSTWLEHDVVELARERFGIPTAHVVVHGWPHSVGPGATRRRGPDPRQTPAACARHGRQTGRHDALVA